MGFIRKNLVGQRFGSLVAQERLSFPANGGRTRIKYRCLCDCGKYRVALSTRLLHGQVTSCGCMTKGRTTHGYRNHLLYTTWASMMQRCYKTYRKDYARYGGRGITVCERWHDVKNFIEDMQPKPEPTSEYSIDRIDSNGPYSPENCRWATWIEQANNRKRRTHWPTGPRKRKAA